MDWWWSFLVLADILTLLYFLAPLFTDGQRSIHDLLDDTRVTRDTTRPSKKSLLG
jgi:uncharacterized RDD family membrane protein YckC